MGDPLGKLLTPVAFDASGNLYALRVDANDNLLVYAVKSAAGGDPAEAQGTLVTPVAFDDSSIPRAWKVDANGRLQVRIGNPEDLECDCGQGKTASYREMIYDNTLTAAGTWSVTSIPSGYDNIEILVMGRTLSVATGDGVYCRFNNDLVDANYTYAQHYAGVAHGVGTGNLPILGAITGGGAAAGLIGVVKAIIPSYALTTFNKCLRTWSGDHRGGGVIYMYDFFTEWANTAAINRIDIFTQSGANFAIGSRLQIYGTC